jgi:hypothetical protein
MPTAFKTHIIFEMPSAKTLGYKMNRAYGFALETELENEKI